MNVARRDVIMIGLSPTGLRVGTLSGGKLAAVNVTPLEPGEWEQAWAQGLSPLDGRLREAVKAAGARTGSAARVVYTGSKAVAEVFSVPADGPTALQAAELSLRETLPDDSKFWPTAMQVLHRDRGGTGDQQGRSHVLAVADSVAGSNTIAAWLLRCGLGTEALIPTKALALARVSALTESLGKDGSHAVLWMGEHVTALAGWSAGRLLFARAVDFGYWMLADAVARAARAQGLSGFDVQKGCQKLMAAGIPSRGQVMDDSTQLLAEQVLPFMQPVIQRYVVETRQTLRFGIPESDLPRTTLHLAGPGAMIPHFGTTLEPQLDVAVERAGALSEGSQSVEAGELQEVIGLETSGFSLVPLAESQRRLTWRLNRGLGVGAVAAGLGLAALAGWSYTRAATASQELRRIEQRTDAMNAHVILRERAETLASNMGAAAKAIRETLGERPRWMAGLAMVSKACGEGISLNHITGAYPHEAGGAPILTLSGTAWPASARDGRSAGTKADSLGGFLDRLAGSPIVASAKIVSTHADVNGGDAKTFVISVQLRTTGPEAAIAAAGGRAPGSETAQAQEPTP
jgi:hypothetical protein